MEQIGKVIEFKEAHARKRESGIENTGENLHKGGCLRTARNPGSGEVRARIQ